MKQKFKIILTSILAVITLAGCDGVSAPNGLAFEDRTLTWNEVRSATSYRVLINEEDELDTTENYLLLPNQYFGALTFQVASLFGESVSEYSDVLSTNVYLTLDAPTNVHQDGSYLKWDEVSYSNGYIVKVGTIENLTSETEYEITSQDPIQVSVLANGSDDGFVVSSSYSESIWFKVALQTPSNIAYENGILSWNAVSNATSYSVVINDASPLAATTNQLDIGHDNVGSINFKVKAISGNDQYVDSAFGEATIQIAPLTLQAPQNLDITSGMLTFDSVEHAIAYGIYHNGSFVEEITTNQYTIPSAILSQSGTYLQVQARSTIHSDSELSVKAYLGAIEINNESELRAMSETGNYSLNSDIVLTSEWNGKNFQGVLNGKGHEISAIQINGTSDASRGFFNNLDGAVVTNVELSGSIDITSNEENSSFGLLAGEIIDGVIGNVHVSGNVDIISTNGIVNVGGLVGRVDGGQIVDSTYSGEIISENAITGGLIGKVSSHLSSLTNIEKSGSEGTLLVTGGEQSFSGGFVGLLDNNNAYISESRSLVNVTGTSYAGGFVGYMAYGDIDNCYSRGALDASSEIYVHAGGFIGRVEGYNNSIFFSIAMMTIGVSQIGDEIYVGSFAGVTPGGTYANIYANCYFDSTLSSFDRIGNVSLGRGDGITGESSANLLSLQNFNVSYWSFTGSYPMLVWEF